MTRQTLRRHAAKMGHKLGRFETRLVEYHYGSKVYETAWCTKCEAVAWTHDPANSPAIKRRCDA